MFKAIFNRSFPRPIQPKIVQRPFTMTSPLSNEPRRFAPLGKKGQDARKDLPTLKGIVFDVDGTLW